MWGLAAPTTASTCWDSSSSSSFNGQLWVTYAKQDTPKHDPVAGAGRGFVNIFGNLLRRFATRGVLDAPWGVVLAPRHFGQFSNDILIGNFGDGKISAWDPKTRPCAEAGIATAVIENQAAYVAGRTTPQDWPQN